VIGMDGRVSRFCLESVYILGVTSVHTWVIEVNGFHSLFLLLVFAFLPLKLRFHESLSGIVTMLEAPPVLGGCLEKELCSNLLR